MEGVATELLYRATLTSLFASVNKTLIQIKNGLICTHLNTFECNIQWQKKIIMGSYKHLSTSYQLFIITEVSCKKL